MHKLQHRHKQDEYASKAFLERNGARRRRALVIQAIESKFVHSADVHQSIFLYPIVDHGLTDQGQRVSRKSVELLELEDSPCGAHSLIL